MSTTHRSYRVLYAIEGRSFSSSRIADRRYSDTDLRDRVSDSAAEESLINAQDSAL
jgi:hypothetical protein